MKLRKIGGVICSVLLLMMLSSVPAYAEDGAEACIECHNKVTPGIVRDYKDSNMTNAIEGPDCTTCHGDEHKTMKDYKKASLPTPETCADCHEKRVKEYKKGKHHLAWFAMKTQAAWHRLPPALGKQGYRGCAGCHKIGQKGLKGAMSGNMGALKYDGGKEESEYRYGNAQCDACHTRHKFSREEAKDPRACSNCHMGFDHPQWEMYISSKHGVAWATNGHENTNGRAPTCQKCHMNKGAHDVSTPWGFLGLRLPTKENVLAIIKAYGWVKENAPYELLAFSHMTTSELVKNLKALAAKLPSGHYDGVDDDPVWVLHRAKYLLAGGVLSFKDLQPTKRFVSIVAQARAARGPAEFNKLRKQMKKNCNECHAKDYVQAHMDASDSIIKASDAVYAKAFDAVFTLYRHGILKAPEKWEFGGPDILQYYYARSKVEQELYLIFLEHRQRAFQGAFHASNDYSHWYGWAPLNTAVNEILYESEHLCADNAQCKKEIEMIKHGYTVTVNSFK
jgi:hypothetical protein